MEKIKLDIIGLSYSQTQTGAYALILSESDGERRLPIIIGGFEAQAIAIELEKMKPSRPLTHDLFKSFAVSFNIQILEVIIHKFAEGVFYAKLIISDGNIEKEIDARTSDAVALSLRFHCPIYTYESVLSSAGILMTESENETKSKTELPDDDPNELKDYTLEELEELLKITIENEDYERASQVRDEIKKREGK
ncbi:MAG: bifunctional nuclease family protein [Bacteroidetes bacterium]|nr:bifunctional nuclease family protein [Bacteroidota bacterium]